MKPLYWKILLIFGALLVAASLVVPKALRKNAHVDWRETPHTELILEVDENDLLQEMLRVEMGQLRGAFREGNIRATVRQKNDALIIGFRSDEHYKKGTKLLENLPLDFDSTSAKKITTEKIKNRLYKLQFSQAYIDYRTIEATAQSFKAISTRVESKKLKFIDIKPFGAEQLLVKVAENSEQKTLDLMKQIRKPIRLNFHEVMNINASKLGLCVQRDICPSGKIALPERNGGSYLMLNNEAVISNADIKGSSVGLHPSNNYPIVNFAYTVEGARKFCKYTTKHEGERFAVVINDEIITAPRINGAICGGRGFIEGSFTMESAGELALSLNAGTLPTKLRVVEERVVTP